MSATILCVQEDRTVFQHYAEVLQAEGYEVLPAHDGGQALEVLRRKDPDFVLLDAQLPRQDGLEILVELRSMPGKGSLPVLLLCAGDVSPDLAARAKRLGAVGVASAPLSPSDLLSRLAEHLSLATVPAAPRVPRQGQLRKIPLPELLHELHCERFDGVLLLEHGKKKKAVELRGGCPVAIKSNLISECLGGYLIRMGRLTKTQLAESLDRMRAGEGMQGEILVAMEVLGEHEIGDVLRDHALEKLYEIFAWPDGDYEVRERMHVNRGTSIGIEGHPSAIVLEGVRRATPLKWIDRYVGMHSDEFLIPRELRPEVLHEVILEPAELAWIHALDGSLKVSALVAEEESLRRLVYGLISIGMLDVTSAAGDPERATAAAAALSASVDPGDLGSEAEEQLRRELAELANRMQDQDHYEVLGVAVSASDDEIRSAFAGLAKRVHPDRYHGASSSVRQLAARVFERISEAHAAIGSEEARAAYARERQLQRRVAEVEDEGQRALAAETEFQRGLRAMTGREYEEALRYFGRAIEKFPSEGEYRSHYGWCLHLCHPDNDMMLEEALEHCREGVRLAKDREKPYLLLGRLYKAMGKAGAARKMFTRAVQIKPQCVEAMRELRIMNMRQEKSKGVIKRLLGR